ncbi:hypothetical protein Peur_061323 [Populus x canadensis]
MLILEACFRYLILILQFAEPFEILTIISMSYRRGLLPCSGIHECPKRWIHSQFCWTSKSVTKTWPQAELEHLTFSPSISLIGNQRLIEQPPSTRVEH